MVRTFLWAALMALFASVTLLGFATPFGAAALALAAELKTSQDDWPGWRGPTSDGAAPKSRAPVEWSATKNILWSAPVPGRGHSSPTVVVDRIFLTTADEQQQIQSVLAFDRESGRQLWKKDLHSGGFDRNTHRKNTQASATVACDGQRIFAVFLNGAAIWATALDLDGKQVWQRNVGPFESHHGYSASPALYKSFVLIAADHKKGGYLAALDRESGEIRWRTERPALPNYPSPIVLNVAGKDQLLMAGCNLVASYDPMSGKQLWSASGTTTECVGTVAASGDLVLASGGYPDSETICIRADGSGEVCWKNNTKTYVPSMLAVDGYAYTVTDNGVAICWQADTGATAWKQRIGGEYSASPTRVGDLIYVSSETGKTVIYRASPRSFELVAENQLGAESFATPIICGDRLYLRVADSSSGKRQETLYAIGEKGEN